MAPSKLFLSLLLALPLTTAQSSSPPPRPDLPLFSPAETRPHSFLSPDSALAPSDGLQHLHALLFRRQSSCAASFTSCSSGNGLCCQPNTHCTTDFNGHVACCPNNAVCTGTISGAGASSTPTPLPSTSAPAPYSSPTSALPSPASSGPATVTVTVPYGAPTAASIATVAAQNPTGTVPNAPFGWAFIPRTFSNAAQCSSYWTGCQSTLAACTSALGGGSGGGVTVVGVGVTTGAAGGNPTSAASVCSSLSTQACGGLQETLCPQYGGSGGTNEARGRSEFVEIGRAVMGMLVGVLGGWVI